MTVKKKLSREEIINSAAAGVARVVLPQLSESEAEKFMELFRKKVTELLEEKGELFLAAGPNVAKNGAEITEEMEEIIKFVEEQTKKEYSFREGQLIIYLTSTDGAGVWLED